MYAHRKNIRYPQIDDQTATLCMAYNIGTQMLQNLGTKIVQESKHLKACTQSILKIYWLFGHTELQALGRERLEIKLESKS